MSILGSRPRTILTTPKCNFKVPHRLLSSIVYSDSILPGKDNIPTWPHNSLGGQSKHGHLSTDIYYMCGIFALSSPHTHRDKS